MANSVQRAFDLAAEDYDRTRRKLVPGFDDFYRTAIDLIPFPHENEIEVLDLGAGTGMLAAFIAYSFPKARITMVDISNEMLERARERFELGGERFQFEVSDYGIAPITRKYDAVVSALSIHHLPDEQKRLLFKRIHDALNDGGVFVNAEQFRGATPELERLNHERWIARARDLGVDEQDLAAAIERMKFDRSATLDDQLEWMREAGFRSIDCAYKNLIFAVYSGRK
ncbi:MAG: methyltransferase domain-containing protein [Candidatus Binatus sp.]|uniref:class I SAM-dependent methyltransferase n=1 Tax=Candidatus Binatus sp. TaxID=2811406 RepID=UPI002718735F|nr:class I SAM-dependent methyltransferase [Candidatus Binatus sp.]MDO8433545.1 methyltransferase domain-containing protein [Candidatus Binatus sp.]